MVAKSYLSYLRVDASRFLQFLHDLLLATVNRNHAINFSTVVEKKTVGVMIHQEIQFCVMLRNVVAQGGRMN